MDVSVFEALAWILAAYRKTFHPPIDYLLSFFSLQIPAAAKDVLVLYIAMSGVLYRTLSYERPSPLRAQLKAQFPDRWRTGLRILVGNIRRYFLALLFEGRPSASILSHREFIGVPRADAAAAQ